MKLIVGLSTFFCMMLIIKPIVLLFKLFGIIIEGGFNNVVENIDNKKEIGSLEKNLKDVSKNGFNL